MDIGEPVLITLRDHWHRVGVIERRSGRESFIVRSTKFDGIPLPEELEEAHVRDASGIVELESLRWTADVRRIVLHQDGGQVVSAAQLKAMVPRDDGLWSATVGTLHRDGSVHGDYQVIDLRKWHEPETIARAIASAWASRGA
jgi:hypothetical protein